MLCPKCGTTVPDDTTSCPNCSTQIIPQVDQPAAEPVQITNWMVPSIIACVLGCCCPFIGIIGGGFFNLFSLLPALVAGGLSIFFAKKANTQAQLGNAEDAQKALKISKIASFVCVGIIVLWFIVSIVLSLVVFAAAQVAQN